MGREVEGAPRTRCVARGFSHDVTHVVLTLKVQMTIELNNKLEELLDEIEEIRSRVCLTLIGCGECDLCRATLKIKELRSEVGSLRTQRRFLVEEARSFWRIVKAMESPCHIFFQGDRVHKVMNTVRDEMAKSERREIETRLHRDEWKKNKERA